MSNDKKTNGNKYSLRDARFYNAWRRMFQFLVTHVFYMIRFKLVYRLEIYGKENNGVRFLVLGTVETAGGGCVCPENVMLKRIINNLVLHRDDIVIMDMEAGLEHLGR